jgi:hypothetical protein
MAQLRVPRPPWPCCRSSPWSPTASSWTGGGRSRGIGRGRGRQLDIRRGKRTSIYAREGTRRVDAEGWNGDAFIVDVKMGAEEVELRKGKRTLRRRWCGWGYGRGRHMTNMTKRFYPDGGKGPTHDVLTPDGKKGEPTTHTNVPLLRFSYYCQGPITGLRGGCLYVNSIFVATKKNHCAKCMNAHSILVMPV